MSEKRTYGFNVMGDWIKGQISSILSTLAGKLDVAATAINSSKLEGSTKAQVLSEVRSGLATTTQVAAKLDATATAANASKLEGKTKAQVVEEARLGLATTDTVASKLGTGDTAANSQKLGGSSKEQVIAEAIGAANLGTIASSDVFLSTVDPTPTDGKDGDFWITYVP